MDRYLTKKQWFFCIFFFCVRPRILIKYLCTKFQMPSYNGPISYHQTKQKICSFHDCCLQKTGLGIFVKGLSPFITTPWEQSDSACDCFNLKFTWPSYKCVDGSECVSTNVGWPLGLHTGFCEHQQIGYSGEYTQKCNDLQPSLSFWDT